jgi:hypothetical protein
MDGWSLGETVSTGSRSANGWGDWRLGDLSDALRRVADVLGPSAPARCVMAYPPSGSADLPCVQLVVEDGAAVQRLRIILSEGEHLPHFLEDSFGFSLDVEVNDVLLAVSVGTAGE